MSSEVIASVLKLYRKADDLAVKGHLLRAAENFGRAANAALALDYGPDNLVTLNMQASQSSVMRNHCEAAVNSGVVGDPLHRADSMALLSAIVASLKRRRVAGTLMDGRCTAAEEAYYSTILRGGQPELFTPAVVASMVKLFGYQTFIRVAIDVLVMFSNAWLFDGECSATQFTAFTQHVVDAADLMQLPRSRGTTITTTSIETEFVELLSNVAAASLGLNSRLVQQLTAAWLRLQQSGVVEARGILSESLRVGASAVREADDQFRAAIGAARAAPNLRSCALAGCSTREAHPKHFNRCSACKDVVYCSKEHQLEAWPAHKKACRAACKAAAASDGAAGPGAA